MKKILIATLLFTSTITNIFSLTYDWQAGLGWGYYQSPLHNKYDFIEEMISYDGYATLSFYDWSLGFFLGSGFSFEIAEVSQSFGLEYKMEYLSSSASLTEWHYLANKSISEKSVESFHSIQHALDIYYRFNFIAGNMPIGLQFNLGLAMLNVLGYSEKYYINGVIEKEYNEFDSMDNEFNLGIHAGIRFNISLLYIGADFMYLPAWGYDGDWYSNQDIDFSFYSKKRFNLSIGLIFNKRILESLKGNMIT